MGSASHQAWVGVYGRRPRERWSGKPGSFTLCEMWSSIIRQKRTKMKVRAFHVVASGLEWEWGDPTSNLGPICHWISHSFSLTLKVLLMNKRQLDDLWAYLYQERGFFTGTALVDFCIPNSTSFPVSHFSTSSSTFMLDVSLEHKSGNFITLFTTSQWFPVSYKLKWIYFVWHLKLFMICFH